MFSTFFFFSNINHSYGLHEANYYGLEQSCKINRQLNFLCKVQMYNIVCQKRLFIQVSHQTVERKQIRVLLSFFFFF